MKGAIMPACTLHSISRRQRSQASSIHIQRPRHCFVLLIGLLAIIGSGPWQGLLLTAQAAPWDLSSYRYCSGWKLEGINDNASGVAYMPEDDSLWVVVNNPPKLMQYNSRSGKLLKAVDINWVRDPEAVARIGAGWVAVSEEPTGGAIRVLDLSQGSAKLQRTISIPLARWSGAGVEGLTYDVNTNTYYVGIEKGPKKVYAIDGNTGVTKELFNADRFAIGDLAELYYAAPVGHLYLLSQESKRVLRVDMSGKLLQDIPIQGNYPEGLTFTPDGSRMWVVSEPNEVAVYYADACPK